MLFVILAILYLIYIPLLTAFFVAISNCNYLDWLERKLNEYTTLGKVYVWLIQFLNYIIYRIWLFCYTKFYKGRKC